MIFLDANFIMSLLIGNLKEHETATKIYEQIKNQPLVISNSIILEVMTVSNIKIKVPKEKLEDIYNKINSGVFEIIEDISLYDDTLKRQIIYHPKRLPFFDCLYLEVMEQLGITKIASFDKHFNNIKGIERIPVSKLVQ